MHGHHVSKVEDIGPLPIPSAVSYAALGIGILALIPFFITAFTSTDAATILNAWWGFMVSYLFFFFLSMGAGAFLAIQYVVDAKWFVVLKRLPESIAAYAYRGGIIFPLIALAGTSVLYSWDPANANYEGYPYPGTLKAAWMSPTMHPIKVCLYLIPLALIMWMLVKVSTSSDRQKDPALKGKTMPLAILFLMAFAVLFSLYCWEAIMSLSPKWYSTMWGVYCFSGAFVSAASLMMLMAFWIQAKSPVVQKRHMFDMGTYVMAFATFMIYIGFSQFMLIWYANLPEETFYYMDRYKGGWWYLTVSLPFFKWIVPFFVLMPSTNRTNLTAQTIACLSVLLGQFLDVYWMVVPTFYAELVLPGIVNVLTFIGIGGVFTWSVTSFLASHPLIPVGDPNLLSSVNGDYLHA